MAMPMLVGRYLSRSILHTFHPTLVTLAGVSSSFTLTSITFSSLYGTHVQTQHTKNAITEFLRNECGLRQSEVTRVMKIRPSLLRTKSSQTAMGAVQFLRDFGLSQTQIKHMIVKNPWVVTCKADVMKVKIEFIKTLGLTAQELPDFICRAPRVLSSKIDRMIKSVDILNQVGVHGELLSLLMSIKPVILSNVSAETLKLKIEYIKNMGFGESSKSFVYALWTVVGRTPENLESKLKYISSLGLLEEEVHKIVKRNPNLLSISTKKMQQNVDFLVGTAGLQPKIVAINSKLLQYSIEKRLRPRYEVFKSLSAMEHTERLPSLLTMLLMTEQKFMEKIVKCSSQAAKLYEVLKDILHLLRPRPEGPSALLILSHSLPSALLLQSHSLPRFLEMQPFQITHFQDAVFGHTSENLEIKLKYMSSLGLPEDEVRNIVKKNPTLFHISKKKMQQNVDFLVGTAGLQPKIVVMKSKLLQFSIEKRLRPLYEVFKSLSAMEHTERLPSLLTLLSMAEQNLMEKIVKCSSQAAKLYEVLKGKPALSTVP